MAVEVQMSSARRARLGRWWAAAGRGFTLIELGVVLAVISIMAAAVMVDVVEIFKNRAAQNNAEELYVLQQAAKDFFHGTIKDGDIVDPLNARWPGEGGPQTCATVANSQPAITNAILQDLKDQDYLKQDFAGKNAWDQPYIIDLKPGAGHGGGHAGQVFDCAMWVATDVPTEVAGVIETYLPLGKCSGCGSASAAGYTRCCTQIPKPGIEASMALAKDAFEEMVRHAAGP